MPARSCLPLNISLRLLDLRPEHRIDQANPKPETAFHIGNWVIKCTAAQVFALAVSRRMVLHKQPVGNSIDRPCVMPVPVMHNTSRAINSPRWPSLAVDTGPGPAPRNPERNPLVLIVTLALNDHVVASSLFWVPPETPRRQTGNFSPIEKEPSTEPGGGSDSDSTATTYAATCLARWG